MTAVVQGETRDDAAERLANLRSAMSRAGLDALICSLPPNVLLLTGYWPVTGRALGIVHRRGGSALVIPEDEVDLARHAGVEHLVPFRPSNGRHSEHDLASVRHAALAAVRALPAASTVGYEHGPTFVPAPYAALLVYGASYLDLTRALWPDATLQPAGAVLARSRAVLTRHDLDRVRVACHLASRAFGRGSRKLRPGMSEVTAADAFRSGLGDLDEAPGAARADGFVYCMSGPNAERAAAAYQRSSRRRLERGEAVLVHCNSYVDGYWTDITRTYCLGPPTERLRTAFAAVTAARAVALGEIRQGAHAAAVDAALRRTLREHGFGAHVRHGCGHGVGFAAIDHDAPPVAREGSEDVLAAGMVLNVEPGVYGADFGGVRHCDMVAVTDDGHELLTPFQTSIGELLRTEDGLAQGPARSA